MAAAAAIPWLIGAQAGMQLLSAQQQGKQAQAQADAQNAALTNQQNLLRYSTEQQLIQNSQETAVEAGNVAQQALKERSRLSALAAETGLAGNSADALAQEINFAKSTATGNLLERNFRNQQNISNNEFAQQSQINAQKAANSQAAAAQKLTLGKAIGIGANAAMQFASYKTGLDAQTLRTTGMSASQIDDYRKRLAASRNGG